MDEVVANVRRVSDIVGEISGATIEQSAGIEEISKAIVHMDEATQQNAALVEQAVAAAQALQEQGAALAQAVGVFKLRGEVAIRLQQRLLAGLAGAGTQRGAP